MERFRNGDAQDGTTKVNGGILMCTDVAARGLDVPDIEWTIQFDAPTDPSQYIHRVGRSARAGKQGRSLIFLTPKEESFVDFLKLRKVPLLEISSDERCSPNVSNIGNSDSTLEQKNVIPDVLSKLKSLVLQDRDLLEKGTKAFTSYIRAYKEHQCAFIFRLVIISHL
jgi:ATP-dependent RNA helicase DDX55/SPB4